MILAAATRVDVGTCDAINVLESFHTFSKILMVILDMA